MNTPAHIIINLAVLGHHRPPKQQLAVVAGSILPDAPMFYFYFVEKVIRQVPESVIWQHYFQPGWQNLIDSFNSLPLMAIGLALAYYLKSPIGIMVSLSMILHVLGDLPVHHEDAHRHLFPFSDWRFESPVSYWDPRHYGQIFMPLEILTVFLCAGWIIFKGQWMGSKVLAGIILTTYGIFFSYAWMMWG